MKAVVIFEDHFWRRLLPLTAVRPAFALRCGCERLIWKQSRPFGGGCAAVFVRPVLVDVMRQWIDTAVNELPDADELIFVNGRWLPPVRIEPTRSGCAAYCDGQLAVLHVSRRWAEGNDLQVQSFLEPDRLSQLLERLTAVEVGGAMLNWPWALVIRNAEQIRSDWSILLQQQGGSQSGGLVHQAAHLLGSDNIRIGRGSVVGPGAVLDAREGPICIDEDVTVSPLVSITGPAYVGRGSRINPHAVIRQGSTIGPVCKIGGELEACVFQGYANKQHDGFLGHSFVGSWCNLGAGTVCSDLKNTYGNVKVQLAGRVVDTGQMFVGAFIGDHTTTAIGTRLTTGAVIGIGCMIAASAVAPKYLPDFTWLTDAGPQRYELDELLRVAERMMSRRKVVLTDEYKNLLRSLADERS